MQMVTKVYLPNPFCKKIEWFLPCTKGDKSTQEQDIRKANEYWADYERRENTNK